MGLLESKCPTCGKAMAIVYEDHSRETLLVDRTCECPSVKIPKVSTD